MGWSIFKSKTFWGAFILGAGQVLGDHSPQGIAMGIGTVLAGAGLRDAIAKSGEATK